MALRWGNNEVNSGLTRVTREADMSLKKKKSKLYGPFLWMGSTASRLDPLRGGSLLFTTKFPDGGDLRSSIK